MSMWVIVGYVRFSGGHTSFTGERLTDIKTRTVKQLNNHDKQQFSTEGTAFTA